MLRTGTPRRRGEAVLARVAAEGGYASGFGRFGLLPLFWHIRSNRGLHDCGVFCGRDERDPVWFWPQGAYSQCCELAASRLAARPRAVRPWQSHDRCPREPVKTWTDRDRIGVFWQCGLIYNRLPARADSPSAARPRCRKVATRDATGAPPTGMDASGLLISFGVPRELRSARFWTATGGSRGVARKASKWCRVAAVGDRSFGLVAAGKRDQVQKSRLKLNR